MDVLESPTDMSAWSRARRDRRIGFVPTMGALHDGHLSLVQIARTRADLVVVSIFVNPLQFDQRGDFDSYPRPMESDLHLCRVAGVDAVYAPTAASMYPEGFQTHVEPGTLSDPLEGAGRPGHFRGVTTVVAKLFNAVRPDVAVFGAKDYQQLAIISRMARDLDMGIEIVAAPTVREDDGLALSSRNRRLGPAARSAAVVINRALESIRTSIADGETNVEVLRSRALAILAAEPLARVEYLSIDDADQLTPVGRIAGSVVASTAVWFDDVRLIDNVLIPAGPPSR
jgi:pantoate--beta-alanine ligase